MWSTCSHGPTGCMIPGAFIFGAFVNRNVSRGMHRRAAGACCRASGGTEGPPVAGSILFQYTCSSFREEGRRAAGEGIGRLHLLPSVFILAYISHPGQVVPMRAMCAVRERIDPPQRVLDTRNDGIRGMRPLSWLGRLILSLSSGVWVT